MNREAGAGDNGTWSEAVELGKRATPTAQPEAVVPEVQPVLWTDATSYSRGEVRRPEPDAWEARLSKLVRVYVTRQHIYYKGKWVMHCEAVGLNCVPLVAATAEDAKAEALRLARRRAREIAQALGERP